MNEEKVKEFCRAIAALEKEHGLKVMPGDGFSGLVVVEQDEKTGKRTAYNWYDDDFYN